MKALFENQEGTAKVLSNSAMKKVLGGRVLEPEFTEHEGCFAYCENGKRVPITYEDCLDGTGSYACAKEYNGCGCN